MPLNTIASRTDREDSPPRRSLSLGLGFVVLLTLIAIFAVATFRESSRIFERIGEIHRQHERAAGALADIRANIYLSGVIARDLLLDPGISGQETFREPFSDIQESTQAHLATLHSILGKDSKAALERLKTELDAYWQPLDRALEWTPQERAAERWLILRQRSKHRTAALTMAAEIAHLNSENFERQQASLLAARHNFERFLQVSTGMLIVLGIVAAAFSVVRILRLERQSERSAAELRRLSHQLVKVQEQERKSISRELHDEVGQMLTGLRMELANLDSDMTKGIPSARQRLLEAKSLAEQTLRCVRNLAMLLRPSMLDDLGITPAIQWQAKEFSRHSGIDVDVKVDGDIDRLGEEQRTCLYRIVQEALTNAARHSQAKSVRISIGLSADLVTATIGDDGVGFDRRRLQQSGLGLLGMEERVRELGGELRVISQPGKGTHVEASLPMNATTHAYSSTAG